MGNQKPTSDLFILGIDPGLGGALALFNLNSQRLEVATDMPITASTRRKRSKEIDIDAVLQFLSLYENQIVLAVVEKVGAAPTDGVVGAFSFGFGTGLIHACLHFHKIPIVPAVPSVWKPSMGLSSDKDESRALATKKFPERRHCFLRKKDHGRAEAALLTRVGISLARSFIARGRNL